MYRLSLPQCSFIALVSAIMLLAASISATAQTGSGKGTISGTVTDKDGEPVVGAFVFYKGTRTGATSDTDGHYSIAAPSKESTLISVPRYGNP